MSWENVFALLGALALVLDYWRGREEAREDLARLEGRVDALEKAARP